MPSPGDIIQAAAHAPVFDAWSTWSPTLTNLTKGSGGTVTARYRQVGKTIDLWFQFVFGTGSAVGTDAKFSLPADVAAHYLPKGIAPLSGELTDASGPVVQARVLFPGGGNAQINYWSSATAQGGITSTAPWTWAAGDALTVWGTYEAV